MQTKQEISFVLITVNLNMCKKYFYNPIEQVMDVEKL